MPDLPVLDRGPVVVLQACVWPLEGDNAYARYVDTEEELQTALNQGWGCALVLRYTERVDKVRVVRNATSDGRLNPDTPVRMFHDGDRWLLHRVSRSKQAVEQWTVTGLAQTIQNRLKQHLGMLDDQG